MAVLIVSMDIHGMDITGVAYLCIFMHIVKKIANNWCLNALRVQHKLASKRAGHAVGQPAENRDHGACACLCKSTAVRKHEVMEDHASI